MSEAARENKSTESIPIRTRHRGQLETATMEPFYPTKEYKRTRKRGNSPASKDTQETSRRRRPQKPQGVERDHTSLYRTRPTSGYMPKRKYTRIENKKRKTTTKPAVEKEITKVRPIKKYEEISTPFASFGKRQHNEKVSAKSKTGSKALSSPEGRSDITANRRVDDGFSFFTDYDSPIELDVQIDFHHETHQREEPYKPPVYIPRPSKSPEPFQKPQPEIVHSAHDISQPEIGHSTHDIGHPEIIHSTHDIGQGHISSNFGGFSDIKDTHTPVHDEPHVSFFHHQQDIHDAKTPTVDITHSVDHHATDFHHASDPHSNDFHSAPEVFGTDHKIPTADEFISSLLKNNHDPFAAFKAEENPAYNFRNHHAAIATLPHSFRSHDETKPLFGETHDIGHSQHEFNEFISHDEFRVPPALHSSDDLHQFSFEDHSSLKAGDFEKSKISEPFLEDHKSTAVAFTNFGNPFHVNAGDEKHSAEDFHGSHKSIHGFSRTPLFETTLESFEDSPEVHDSHGKSFGSHHSSEHSFFDHDPFHQENRKSYHDHHAPLHNDYGYPPVHKNTIPGIPGVDYPTYHQVT